MDRVNYRITAPEPVTGLHGNVRFTDGVAVVPVDDPGLPYFQQHPAYRVDETDEPLPVFLLQSIEPFTAAAPSTHDASLKPRSSYPRTA